MRFGIFSVVDHYPSELPRALEQFYGELMEQGRFADELGFHSFWIAEHHFHEYGAIPRPAIFLAALASITRKIKLGSAVAVLPFDHPLRVAEDFAMLDLLSNGRLEFGVGSGYLQHEFAGFNLDTEDRRERFDEYLNLICKAWTGEKFSFAGKHIKVDDVQLNVLPLQKPAPEIFIAVLRNEVAPFVGKQKRGMMMIPYAGTENLAELAETVKAYRKAFFDSGNANQQYENCGAPGAESVIDSKADVVADSENQHVSFASARNMQRTLASADNAHIAGFNTNARVQFGLHCYCAEDTKTAREFARSYMDRYVRTRLYAKQRSFDELIEKNLIAVGDPEEIARVARLYEAAGLDDFLMIMNFGGLPHQAVKNSMRLIATHVLP